MQTPIKTPKHKKYIIKQEISIAISILKLLDKLKTKPDILLSVMGSKKAPVNFKERCTTINFTRGINIVAITRTKPTEPIAFLINTELDIIISIPSDIYDPIYGTDPLSVYFATLIDIPSCVPATMPQTDK